jgi:hypothetical protein
MTIKESLYDIAKISKDYNSYLENIKIRFGNFAFGVKRDLIDSIFNRVHNTLIEDIKVYRKLST